MNNSRLTDSAGLASFKSPEPVTSLTAIIGFAYEPHFALKECIEHGRCILSEAVLVMSNVENRVCTLSLNNPPANGYSYEMMRQLDDAILEARFNEDVDVIVITGTGDRFFCAGADIGELSKMTPEFKYQFCLHANETLNRLASTSKLVIAAINGHCVGGGLEVALAADIRVGAAGHYKLGLPESKLGVLAGTGGTQRAARILGTAKAIELMATGDNLTPETAKELGLLNQVIDGEDFKAEAQKYAEQFTNPSASACAIGAMKLAVHAGVDGSLLSGLAVERELQQQLFKGQDSKEGMTAFLERRPAQFGGKES